VLRAKGLGVTLGGMARSRKISLSTFALASSARAMRGATIGVVAGLCFVAHSHAALGEDQSSVQADQRAWGASVTVSARGATTVHTQLLPNGITVRQYLDSSGSVFAVAWDGPILPDFARLLGTHFAVYAQAVRQQSRGVNVHRVDLVMESGGMMRSFGGRAYLPGKLPADLAAQDIR
jgi:hypothetical protein